MFAIALLKEIYDFGQSIYKDLTAPPSDDDQRRFYLNDALRRLHEESGHLIDVYAVQGKYQGGMASDVQVSIIFKVQARPKELPKQLVEQHISYSVDTSSWATMGRDLMVLGQHFAMASQRAYPTEDETPEELLYEYLEIVREVEQRGTTEPKL